LEILAALQRRKNKATLNATEKYGRLRDADALCLHPCQPDDFPGYLWETHHGYGGHRFDDCQGEQSMAGPRLLVSGLMCSAGRQQDASLAVDAVEGKRAAGACRTFEYACRRLTAKATIEDA
jgi:hypothetical protein